MESDTIGYYVVVADGYAILLHKNMPAKYHKLVTLHELAHCVAHQIHPKNHGDKQVWKSVMKLFGQKPKLFY